MTLLFKLLVALVALALLAGGLGFALAPTQLAPDFAVAATSANGLGTLRADLGGLFVAASLFAFAGLRAGGARWLAVPLVIIGVILVLRLWHLAVDGVTPEGLRSLGVEVVIVVVLAAARRVLARDA